MISLGANGRNRTADPRITNALLYQLSYVGNPKNASKLSIVLHYVKLTNAKFSNPLMAFRPSRPRGVSEEISLSTPVENGLLADLEMD